MPIVEVVLHGAVSTCYISTSSIRMSGFDVGFIGCRPFYPVNGHLSVISLFAPRYSKSGECFSEKNVMLFDNLKYQI